MNKGITQAVSNGIFIALPTLLFVTVANRFTLTASVICAAIIALATFALKAVQKQPLVPAIAGLAIVTACISMALLIGQKRAFFLLPAIILPAAISVVILISIAIRRPLAGLLLNNCSGGPENWRHDDEYRSMYTSVTWICFAVNAGSGLLQRAFYVKNQLLGLTLVHVFVPIVFSVIIVLTLIQVRHLQLSRGRIAIGGPYASQTPPRSDPNDKRGHEIGD